jgi:hypothetical protein
VSFFKKRKLVNKENWPKTVQHDATHQPQDRSPNELATLLPKQLETTLKTTDSGAAALASEPLQHTQRSQDRVPTGPTAFPPK